MRRLALLASLLLAACSSAYSDGRATTQQPMMVAGGEQTPTAAPYGFEILDGDGRALQTFDNGGRFYVLGDSGDRYIIHITNPTDRRVEAVVSVDGLDVIDGEEGDLAKRGYVVPPHGDLAIEGFRTSTSDVATFRFSSVEASYAGRKGKARNVGVIAVAIFDEAAPQEIILEQEVVEPVPPVVYYDTDSVKDYGGGDDRVSATKADAPNSAGGGEGAPGRGYRRPPPVDETSEEQIMQPPPPPPDCCNHEDKKRGGLGTEYGEQRYSAATWTKFERSSATPTAVAELRYNDAAGLAAIGIDIAQPASDPEEVTKRETADPFPGDPNFSKRP